MSYLGEDIRKLGFGLMRLPQKDDGINVEQVKEMVDLFLEAGFMRHGSTARPKKRPMLSLIRLLLRPEPDILTFICYIIWARAESGAGGVKEDSFDSVYLLQLLCESLSAGHRHLRIFYGHELSDPLPGPGSSKASGGLACERSRTEARGRMYPVRQMRGSLSAAYRYPGSADEGKRTIVEVKYYRKNRSFLQSETGCRAAGFLYHRKK